MEKSSLICIVPDSALGCKHLDKIDIKRKDFSALKSERVQKKQKILTSVPLNKDFWCILIEKRKNHFLFLQKYVTILLQNYGQPATRDCL